MNYLGFIQLHVQSLILDTGNTKPDYLHNLTAVPVLVDVCMYTAFKHSRMCICFAPSPECYTCIWGTYLVLTDICCMQDITRSKTLSWNAR